MASGAVNSPIALAPGADIRCSIEKLVYGGQGLARLGRQVVFVDGVLPGEEVRARITSARRQCYFACAVEVIRPSQQRVVPPCRYVHDCGGCHWQHIDYTEQVQLKTAAVRECFGRIARLPEAPVFPSAPSPAALGYRTRARFRISPGPAPGIGFYRRRSHSVIDVERCLVCADPVNEALASCRRRLHDSPACFGAATKIDIQCSLHAGTASVTAGGPRGRPVSYACRASECSWQPSAAPLRDTLGGLHFIRAPGSFYQGNAAQNEHMIACVAGIFDRRRHRRVLDVCCGCGNFSLFLARAGIDVTGVDSHAPSVREARANAHTNGLKNCAFHADHAENIGRRCAGRLFEGVLLNPPRTGCSAAVLRSVGDMRPQTIAYVSCNPATLSRDCVILMAAGYRLKTVQPFDLFPHTYHIECIAVLEREQAARAI